MLHRKLASNMLLPSGSDGLLSSPLPTENWDEPNRGFQKVNVCSELSRLC